MFVIPPLAITEDVLDSSTCAEPADGEAAYSGGATYAAGDEVINATTHRTYKSLAGSNTGHALPDYTQGETQNDWWLDIGPSRKWAMFDLFRNSATTTESPLIVTLIPGVRVDSIGLFGLVGDSVTVTVSSGGDVMFERTISLNTRTVVDWYGYFFTPFSFRRSVLITDLPPYTDAEITITVGAEAGDVSCASVVLGTSEDLGKAQYGAKAGALNFSKIDRGEFGDITLTPRRSVPKLNIVTWADAGRSDRLRQLRDELNAVPAVWVGLKDSDSPYFETLVIVGIYKEFEINVDHAKKVVVTLELEET